jgi:hypothetical protein
VKRFTYRRGAARYSPIVADQDFSKDRPATKETTMAHTIAIYGIAFMSILLVGGLNLFDNDFQRKGSSGAGAARGAQTHDIELDAHL